jgi:molybdate transport system ATP-binding protein
VIWEIALRHTLRQRQARFDLDVAWTSDAPRVALVGPSGAGKTQTLKLVAGIARPNEGRVALGSRVLYDRAAGIDLAPQARRLALVFQDYALFPHLTLRQNIAFARRPGWTNPPRAPSDAAVERWIERFGLAPVADHAPYQASGGQRQRTALARALVNEPAALLLDEPFAALDRALRRRLRDELNELLREVNLPLLLVTHDEDDVAHLADEVVYLEAGRVWSPEEMR